MTVMSLVWSWKSLELTKFCSSWNNDYYF